MIPDSFLQELKYASDMEQVVSSYNVRLVRHGKTLTGLCPFHNEKSPSFTVYPENQSFYCFGCGAGGDVITFVRRAENLEYMEAVRMLASRAGLAVPDEADDGTARLKMRVLECNRAAARFFYDTLVSPGGARGLDYFRSRALSGQTLRRFGLGYAPEGWDGLAVHMKEQGFTEEDLLAACLVSRGKSGKGCYDVFRGRVMFPIIDLRGNVVGFGGRNLDGDGPKYLNSRDTPVFKKSRNLYALNRAKGSPLPGLILAEGYMDVIALHQAGFDNAVATLGTSLTAEQAQLISKYAREAIIAYDADGAGQAATRRAIGLFGDTGVKVRVLRMEGAKDPDEYIRKFGATRFKLLLDQCANAMEFEIARLRALHDTGVAEGKVAFLNEFARLMADVRNPVERDVYLKRTAAEMDVSPEAMRQLTEADIKRRGRRENRRQQRDLDIKAGAWSPKPDPERDRNLRYALAEEKLLALLLKNPDYYEYIAARIMPEQFVTAHNRALYTALCERLQNGQSVELMSLSAALGPEDMSYVARLLAGEVQEKQPCSEADIYTGIILEHRNEKKEEEIGAMDERDWAAWLLSTAKGGTHKIGGNGIGQKKRD